MVAQWLRTLADRLDNGKGRRPQIIVNAAIDPQVTAREVQRILVDLKRRNGGAPLGLG